MSNKVKPIFRKVEIEKKGWGEEVYLANNEHYCGKLLKFNKGSTFSLHAHDSKIESFYLLFGRVEFRYLNLENAEPMSEILFQGDVVDIPRLCFHQVHALEDSTIIEISTFHRSDDSFRVGKGDGQK